MRWDGRCCRDKAARKDSGKDWESEGYHYRDSIAQEANVGQKHRGKSGKMQNLVEKLSFPEGFADTRYAVRASERDGHDN